MGIIRGSEDISDSSAITDDEAALYDRQLRLWGIEAQRRLRRTKVLMIGIGGLGAEVVKNIVLAGVKSITLLDDKNVGPSDRFCQFLVAGEPEGENRAKASHSAVKQLNPNVEVISDTSPLQEKDASFFAQFDIICATNCPADYLVKIDNICREKSIKFLSGDVWGLYGYCFMDLVSYTFLNKAKENDNKSDDQLEKIDFISLAKAITIRRGKLGTGLNKKISKAFFLFHIFNKFYEAQKRFPLSSNREEDIEILKSLRPDVMKNLGYEESKLSDEDLSMVFGEISPVCAVVGGILAQEIIKAVCAVEIPFKNFFLFDGINNVGTIENIG